MPPPAPRQAALRQTNDGSAQSGTLTCGGVIPQNAESVFPNLPPGQIKLDYDQRIWTSRLVPGERDTQRLILKNVSSGPRKTCVVHWSAIR
jgi:hypothetical protein